MTRRISRSARSGCPAARASSACVSATSSQRTARRRAPARPRTGRRSSGTSSVTSSRFNLTRNKMPRWLSEGIRLRRAAGEPGVGREAHAAIPGQFILGDDLTPISEMSGAFLKARSPLMLQFAYYQSSLVVEFLVERYGLEKLRAILTDLGQGVEINAAIAKHTAPMKQLETEFAALARERTAKLGAGARLGEGPERNAARGVDARDAWETGNPTNYNVLMRQAPALPWREKKWHRSHRAAAQGDRRVSPRTPAPQARARCSLRSLSRAEGRGERARSVAGTGGAGFLEAPGHLRAPDGTGGRAHEGLAGCADQERRAFLAVNPLLLEPHRAPRPRPPRRSPSGLPRFGRLADVARARSARSG